MKKRRSVLCLLLALCMAFCVGFLGCSEPEKKTPDNDGWSDPF